MDIEEWLEKLKEFAESRSARIAGFCEEGEDALELARRGFVIVGNLYSKPRALSVEELEFIVAKEKGNVQ